MLNPAQFRPDSLTTIYTHDIDLVITEQNFKVQKQEIADAFNNGLISLSVQNPTQSKMGAVLVDVSQLDTTFNVLLKPLQQSAKDMGFGSGAVGVDFTTGKLEIPIEMYQQSAFVKQISHDVNTLPT